MKKIIFSVCLALMTASSTFADYCGWNGVYYNPAVGEFCCDDGQEGIICRSGLEQWCSAYPYAECVNGCPGGQEYIGMSCRRCSAGTYANAGVGQSCQTCPKQETIAGMTSGSDDSNYDSITDCYIPSGSTFTDTTGTYQYPDNCYYKVS